MTRNCDNNRYFVIDSQRKIVKFRHSALVSVFSLALISSSQVARPDTFTQETPNPIIWRNVTTGYSLDGFDPVSYFGNSGPVRGARKYEYAGTNTVWLFTNKGNLAAFRDDPEIYTPQYGGHDAYAMSRGIVVEPNPLVWHIKDNRLYLFHSHFAKTAWINNELSLTVLANEQWQSMVERATKALPKSRSSFKPR